MGNKGSRSKNKESKDETSDLRHKAGHHDTHAVESELKSGQQQLPAISAAAAVRVACLLGWIEARELHKTVFMYRSNGRQLSVASLVDAAMALSPSDDGQSLQALQRLRAELVAATPHCIACAVKQILHKCNPIIPADHYEEMVQLFAKPLGDSDVSAAALRLRGVLTGEGQWLLPLLLLHLHQVQKHSDSNHMQTQALATVFGPVLLRYPPPESPEGGGASDPQTIMKQHSEAAVRSNTSLENLLGATPALLRAMGHPWAHMSALVAAREAYHADEGPYAPLPMAPLLPPAATKAVPRLLQEAEEWDTWLHSEAAGGGGGEGKGGDADTAASDAGESKSHDSARDSASHDANSPASASGGEAPAFPAPLHVPSLPVGETVFEETMSASPTRGEQGGAPAGGVLPQGSSSLTPAAESKNSESGVGPSTPQVGATGPIVVIPHTDSSDERNAVPIVPLGTRLEVSDDLGGRLTQQGPESGGTPPVQDAASSPGDGSTQDAPTAPLVLQGGGARTDTVPPLALRGASDNTEQPARTQGIPAERGPTAPHPEHSCVSGRTGFSWDDTSVASGSREVSDSSHRNAHAPGPSVHSNSNTRSASTSAATEAVAATAASSEPIPAPQGQQRPQAGSTSSGSGERESSALISVQSSPSVGATGQSGALPTSQGSLPSQGGEGGEGGASPPGNAARKGGKTYLLGEGKLTTLAQLQEQVQASRSRRDGYEQMMSGGGAAAVLGGADNTAPDQSGAASNGPLFSSPGGRAERAVAWAHPGQGGSPVATRHADCASPESGGTLAVRAPMAPKPTPLQVWAAGQRARVKGVRGATGDAGAGSVARLYATRQYSRMAGGSGGKPALPTPAATTPALARYSRQQAAPRRAQELSLYGLGGAGGASWRGGSPARHPTVSGKASEDAPIVVGGVDLTAMAARWNV